jgi:cation diffusion facilitator family transporter
VTEFAPLPAAIAGRTADPAAAARLTARVTTLSVLVALGLSAVKLWGWRATGSTALLASFGDSALDLVAAGLTYWAVRYAVAPPDDDHRFGHGKAEAFASLWQAGLMLVSAALIGREAAVRLVDPRPIQAEGAAAAIMGVSIVMTLVLLAVQARVIAATGSLAVKGDRAHYAADLASNLAALAGIGAARLSGDARFDAAGGLFVAAWLAWGAYGLVRESSHHLMDRELSDAERDAIRRVALDDPQVIGVHQLKTRASGPSIHVQMHMELDPYQTLEAAHVTVHAAEQRIRRAFPGCDVLIHADPAGLSEDHDDPFPEDRITAPAAR